MGKKRNVENRGVTGQVVTAILEGVISGTVTVDQVATDLELPRKAVSNSLNYIHRTYDDLVEKVPNKWGLYKIIYEDREHANSDVDVLEDLLSAMAKAEPTIRKMIRLQRAFEEQ